MYFCNLVTTGNPTNVFERKGRVFGVEYLCLTELSVDVDGTLPVEFQKIGTCLSICEAGKDNGEIVDTMGVLSYDGCAFSEEELRDTVENPAIWVLAKDAEVLEGVPSYLKYITVGENLLICLLYGALDYQSADGERFSLSRGIEDIALTPSGRFVSEFVSMNTLKDEVTGIPLADVCTNALFVEIGGAKSKSSKVTKIRHIRECFTPLYAEIFPQIQARQAVAKEKAEALQMEKDRERQEELDRINAKYEEGDERRRAMSEAKENLRKKEQAERRQNKAVRDIPDAAARHRGAAAFLGMVQQRSAGLVEGQEGSSEKECACC